MSNSLTEGWEFSLAEHSGFSLAGLSLGRKKIFLPLAVVYSKLLRALVCKVSSPFRASLTLLWTRFSFIYFHTSVFSFPLAVPKAAWNPFHMLQAKESIFVSDFPAKVMRLIWLANFSHMPAEPVTCPCQNELLWPEEDLSALIGWAKSRVPHL